MSCVIIPRPGTGNQADIAVGIIVAGQAAVDGLAEQRNQVVADVAAGTALLEIVGGDRGKVQDGTMLFVQYPGPTTGGRPIYEDRFNLAERRPLSQERLDV